MYTVLEKAVFMKYLSLPKIKSLIKGLQLLASSVETNPPHPTPCSSTLLYPKSSSILVECPEAIVQFVRETEYLSH